MEEKTSSLFGDDLHSHKKNGYIALSKEVILGSKRVEKRVVKRGDTTYEISESTLNDKRIEDTCIEIFQSREIKNEIDLKSLVDLANKELEEKFIKYNLVESADNPKSKNLEIRKKRQIAVNSFVKEELQKQIPKEISFPFKELIERTSIKRIQGRTNEALVALEEASKKNTRSWNNRNIDFSGPEGVEPEIVNDITTGSIVPKFRIRVKDSIKKVANLTEREMENLTLEKFIDLKIRNKAKYIEKVILVPDAEAIIDVIGAALFNTGHAKSIRKNRDKFSNKVTFDLDLLVRTFVNAQYIDSISEFTFSELKKCLGQSDKLEWLAFKKVFIPAIKDLNENTEIDLTYKLLPSQKDWTHIKLIAKYKTNSLGFEAERMGFDFLAYFIAIQHKYFQKNNLSGKFIAFIASIQSTIWTDSFRDGQEELYGRNFEEWKEYATKAYHTEKKLLEALDENSDLLIRNSLMYDERKMCLVKKKKINDDEIIIENGDIKLPEDFSNTSIIKMPTYIVCDPMTSLKYINELSTKDSVNDVFIHDFIPFEIASLDADGWIKINDLEDFSKHKEYIRLQAFRKKASFFRFESKEKKEWFILNLERESFKEFTVRFRELMEELS